VKHYPKVICANFEISRCAGAHPHLYIGQPLEETRVSIKGMEAQERP